MTNGEVINAILTLALTGAGVVIARQQWKQTKVAQASEDRQRIADARRFALEILEPLASPEIHEVLNDRSSEPPRNTSLVQAVFTLCEVKVTELLPADVRGDKKIQATIDKAMDPAKQFLSRHGGPDYSESVERLESVTAAPDLQTVRNGVDHTKYSWEGTGRHSKIWTINLIAQRFAETAGLTTREAFEEAFLAEIGPVVRDRAVSADRLLRETTSANEKTNYVPELLLTLDGKKYAITWAAGASDLAQIGVAVHKPIIEHFRLTPAYPVAPA